MTAVDQVARLLALTPYLQARPNAPLPEVAAHFGVSPAQLRADLGVLYMCGLPGLLPGDLIEIDMEAVDGRGVINLSNADYLARPMRFTPAEVAPLIIGLDLVRGLAGPGVVEAVDSALAKLRVVAGESAAGAERLSVAVEGADSPVRATLAAAIAAGRRVELTYDADSRAERTTREVDPAELSTRDGYAYLEAWSLTDPPGWRSFRLDRIVAARELGVPVEDHPDRPLATPDWAGALAGARRVRLRLSPQARWVAEYYTTEDVVERADGVLEVSLPVLDPAWLRRLLLQRGAEVTVLDPPAAAADAARAAAEALAAYAALGADPAGSAAGGDGPAEPVDGADD